MTYDEWELTVPEVIRRDTLWRVKAYRLGLFLSDLAWEEAGKLLRNWRTTGVANQLFRAAGNISSNVGEGYSRGTGKQRALFYEYALGSARESRDWYYKGRRAFSEAVVSHRMQICTDIVRLTLEMIRTELRLNRRPSGDS